jgi:gamma-glutamylaminecyclotransferase
MTNLHRLFVYGTLRRGERNHRLLTHSAFVGLACTVPGFRLYNLGHFPGMVAISRGRVHGELVDVDDATLARVDELESHPRFYLRTPIALADGQIVETYLLRVDQVGGRPAISGGDWTRRSPGR